MTDFRGSSWQKCDLHIHSNASDGKMTCEEIVDKAIEKGLNVIALTDHHTVKNIDEIVRLGIAKGIKVIPGVEFRTEYGKKSVHLIGLFPDEFNNVKICSQSITEYILNPLNISETEIKRKGKEKLEGEGKTGVTDEAAFNAGMFEVQVVFKDAADLIHKKLGGIVIVHAGSKANSLDEEMAHSGKKDVTIYESLGPVKEELFKGGYIDVCEIRNEEDSKEFYLNTFNKPSIVASDAHELDEIGSKFIWFKGEPTFEGLKQIKYEPKHRISFTVNKPYDPTVWLRKASFSFPDTAILNDEKFCFSQNFTLAFSPNFTCLIGGRGTGKSTIINLLHDKIKPSDDGFFKQYKLTNSANGAKINIDASVDIGDEIDATHIEFISQNEIEKFALDNNALTNAIYYRIKKIDTEGTLDSFEEQFISEVDRLNEYINNILELHTKQTTLKEKTKELGTNKAIVDSYQSERYTVLNQTIKDLTTAIKELKTSKENYLLLTSTIQSIQEKYAGITGTNDYDKANQEIIARINSIKTYSDGLNFSETEVVIKGKEFDLSTAKLALSDYLKEKGVSMESLNDISSANTKITKIESEIDDLNIEIAAISEKLVQYEESAESTIGNDYKEFLENKIQEISTQLEKIQSSYVKTISLKYEFDFEAANNAIYEEFKEWFAAEITKINLKGDYLNSILFAISPKDVTTKDALLEAISSYPSSSNAKVFLLDIFEQERNFKIYQTIIRKHLINSFDYKKIKVFYDSRRIEDTSFGQRCTAALVILLNIGNNPIIIDEPEAHLDSLLISNYLVELIKEKKNNRQIIFATHNANFVVNGDAELIHILDSKNDKSTEITSTTIEQSKTRDRLIGLEGGKEAFENRENKYFY